MASRWGQTLSAADPPHWGMNGSDGGDQLLWRAIFVQAAHDPADPASLSDNIVPVVYTDHTGQLWVGTRNGLSAYNSQTNTFTRYQHDPANPASLSDNRVITITEDPVGMLWIGTMDGLNRFDPSTTLRAGPATGRFTVYRHDPADPHSLSHDLVAALHSDRTGALWVATDGGGLNHFDPATGRFAVYRHDPADPHSLSSDSPRTIYEDRAGTLWVGTWGGGLNRFDPSTALRAGPATGGFTVYRHDPADPTSLSDDRITTLDEDDAGALWVGTYADGINILDSTRQHFTAYRRDPVDPDGLNQNRVVDIFRDRSGLTWVATTGGGVNLYNPQQQAFTIYRHDPGDANSLASDTILAVYEDRDGILWLGTQEQGLDRLDRRTGQITHYPPDPTNPQRLGFPTIYDIQGDPTGALWLATYGGGLYHLDPATGRFTPYRHDPADPHSLSSDTLTCIRLDPSGNLWLGTYGGGLNRFNPSTGVFTAYRYNSDDPHSLINDNVNWLSIDQQGLVWAGSPTGLSRLDPATGQVTRFQHDPQNPASLSNNSVFKVYVDRAGVVWAATFGGGLSRFDPSTALRAGPATESFSAYGTAQGLADDIAGGIMEEGNTDDTTPGNLWIVHSRALTKLDQARQTLEVYDSSNGLPRIEFSRASLMSAAGELLLGSLNGGLIILDPAKLQTDPEPPPVVFTDFLLANKPVAVGADSLLKQAIDQTDTLELTYADRVISFEFAALSYRAPQQNRYRYMLEGFDPEWNEVDATRRLATYTNLDPGRYVFRVTGSNGDGVWNETGRAITVIVTPPWWETGWFRGLALALVISAVAAGYGWRVNNLQVQQRRLEAQIAERTRELAEKTEALTQSNTQLGREIGERKQAEAALHQNIEDLTLLNQISRVAAMVTDLQAIPQAIAEFTTALFNASHTIISTFNQKQQTRRVVAWHAATAAPPQSLLGRNYPLGLDPVDWQLLETKRSVLMTDPQGSPHLAEVTRQTLQEDQVQCLLLTPLLVRAEVIGYLSLASARPDYHFTPDEVKLAETVAGQIAGAIDTARLFNREQRQRHLADQRRVVAESLGGILAMLNSNQPLPETLDYIAGQTNHLLGSDANALFKLDAAGSPTLLAAHGIPTSELAQSSLAHEQAALSQAAAARRSVVVSHETGSSENGAYPTLLAVPLLLKEEVYGGLILYFAQAQMFSEETMELANTFSHQVALALENAHLRDQVREVAVAEERNRIARDLHDAVTQILYSASLIAAALPQLWDVQPQEARRSLDKLGLLMRGALAEMRTLLLELRPKTLIESKLSVLLNYLANALIGRTRIPVKVTLTGDGILPPEVQIAFYRIAQETLNNIGKHAQAGQVDLDLHFQPDKVMLQIRDDGCGFELEALPPGHLGISIMHERAKAIEAALQVISQRGAGTQVILTWFVP